MPRNLRYLLLLLSSLIISCDDGGSVTDSCSIKQQNRSVHEILLDKYLWYQDVPSIIDFSYDDFDSPQQMLDFLIDQDRDRFSYLTQADDFDSLYNEGQYVGYGFSYWPRSDGTVVVRFVYSDSPAGVAGLERGDQILSINDQSVADIINALAWDTVLGPSEVGYPVDMVVRKADGSTIALSMEKAVVNINTVLHSSIIDNGSESVGYLVFSSFLGTSNEELAEVFEEFHANSVRRLVLDLRYNGGGSIAVANNLASYLFANNQREVFAELVYNGKYQSNSSYVFNDLLTDALDIDQLVVITTAATCSASEMIINGLDPFVEVITVGETTCGKPVGMNPFQFCDNILLPVTFSIVNRDGVGDYFDGLPADCPAQDDPSVSFGDRLDPMLSEALYVTQNSSCSPISRSIPSRPDAQSKPLPSSLRFIIGDAV